MRRNVLGLMALAAAWACLGPAVARADTTITTREGATNAFGQAVKASAQFTVYPDRIIVRLTNQTPTLESFEQTLTGLSFKVPAARKDAHMGFTRATVRVVSESDFNDARDMEETRWTVSMSGSTVRLKAPGERYTILPEAPDGFRHYPKIDRSVWSAKHNPYLAKTVLFQVIFPESGLTDDLQGVEFHWGNEEGGAAKLREPGDMDDAAGGAPEPNAPPPDDHSLLYPSNTGPANNDLPPGNLPSIPPLSTVPNTPPVSSDPPPETPPEVPEPTTLGLLALPLAATLLRKRSR